MRKPTPFSQNLASFNELASASRVDSNLANQQINKDLINDDFSTLVGKYGINTANQKFALTETKLKQQRALNESRNLQTITGDSLLSFGKGLYNSASGAVTKIVADSISETIIPKHTTKSKLDNFLSGNIVIGDNSNFKENKKNKEQLKAVLSSELSNTFSKGTEVITNLQSDVLNKRKEIVNLDRNQKDIDSAAKFEQQKADNTSLPSLRRIGRDFVNELATLKDNPSLAGDLTAEATGSFVTSATLSKLLGSGKLGTATAIGAIEASGVYSHTLQTINSMSEEELLKGSARYKELRKTLSHEKARAVIADKAAGTAAAIQFPVAAVLGAKLDKITAAPFKKIPKGDVLKSFGQEAIEEGLQSATGELFSNIAIKKFADSQKELSEGIGAAGAQGVVGGIGVTGVVKTPSAVTGSTKVALEGTVNAANTIIDGRKQNIKNSLDKDSEVGSEAVVKATEQIKSDTSQQATELNSVLTEEELGTIVPSSLKETVNTSTRIDTLNKIVSDIDSKSLTEEQEQQGALFVFEQIKALEQVILDNPENSDNTTTTEALNTIISNPAYKKAVEKAYSQVQKIDPENPPEINDDFINTTNRLAKANPSGVDPNAIDLILDQKRKGIVNFSPEIEKSLRASGALIRQINSAKQESSIIEQERVNTIQSQASTKGKVPARKTRDIVSQEIRIEGNNSVSGLLPSINDHYVNIIGSINNGGKITDKNGNVVETQASFDYLGRFVQHQLNKLDAVNKSAALNKTSDNGVSFDTLNPFDNESFIPASEKGASTVYINPNSPNSIATAKQILVDTNIAINSYNDLLDIYPNELQGTKFEKVTLPNTLLGSVNNAAPAIPEAGGLDYQKAVEDMVKSGLLPSSSLEQFSPSVKTSASPSSSDNTQPEPTTVPAIDSSVVSPVSSGADVSINTNNDLQASNESSAPNITRPIENLGTLARDGAIVNRNAPDIRRASDTVDSSINDEIAPVESSEAQNAKAKVENASSALSTEVASEVNEISTSQNASSLIDVEETNDQSLLQQTEGQEASETEIKDEVIIKENLIKDADGISRFNRAFKFVKEKSKLFNSTEPINTIGELLNDDDNLNYSLDVDKKKAVNDFLNKYVPIILNNLNDSVKNTVFRTSKTGNLTYLDALKAGNINLTSFRTGKVLTLIDSTTFEYDKGITEQAIIAAIHWVINSSTGRVVNAEYVAKVLDIKEDEVTNEQIRVFNSGFGVTNAKEGLSQVIQEFWGTQPDNNVTLSDTRGIPEMLASEILAAMSGGLLVTIEKQPINIFDTVIDKNTGKEIQKEREIVTISSKTDAVVELTEKLGSAKTVLKDVISIEKETNPFEPNENIPKTQKRNNATKTTKTVKKAIKNLNNIKNTRNNDFVSLMSSIGEEAFNSLMGTVTDLEKFNVEHRKTVEGKNLTNKINWDYVINHNQAIEDFATKNGLNPDDVNTYYSFYESVNNRLFQETGGGQSNKHARQAFIPTKVTLDLTKKDDLDAFWITVAQSSGLVSTEKLNNNEIINKIQKDIEIYGETISVLTDWLQEGKKSLTSEQINIIKNNIGTRNEPILLNTLLSVASFYEAKGTENEAKFTHTVSLEADGKTDGPANAMVHFTSGSFKNKQIKLLSKVGLFIGKQDRTYADHYKNDNVDLYEIAASAFKNNLLVLNQTLRDSKVGNKDAANTLQALINFTNYFGEIDFDYEKGTITVGRGVLKNPLTVSVYGSGKQGITNKVSSLMIDAFYEELTNWANGSSKFDDYNANNKVSLLEDINLLFGGFAVYGTKKEKWFYINEDNNMSDFQNDPINFKFTPKNKEIFRKNIGALFVGPMIEAVDVIMAEPKQNINLIQKSTQIQSLVMRDLFNQEVKNLRKEKYLSGELIGKVTIDSKTGEEKVTGEFLSKNDYDSIFIKLEKFGAIIESEDQITNFGTGQKADTDFEFGRTLDNQLSSKPTIQAPSEAGVSAAALITQGRGDGLNILKLYSQDNELSDTLPVFDGIELPANKIKEHSQRINKAVTEAWLENPFNEVAKSFNDFLRQNPFDNISDETINSIYDSLKQEVNIFELIPEFTNIVKEYNKKNNTTFENMEELVNELDIDKDSLIYKGIQKLQRENLPKIISNLQNDINSANKSIDARKKTLNFFEHSSDHMPSGQSPYNHKGEKLENIEQLNEKYYEFLNAPEPVYQNEKKFMDALKQYGTEENNIRIITSNNFINMINRYDGLSPELKSIYESIRGQIPNLKLLFGSTQDLTAYRDSNFPKRNNGELLPEGQIDLLNGIVYVTNQSAETAIHEMVHATTIGKVLDYYTNKDKLSEIDQLAVKRLEALMNEFITKDFSYEDSETQQATESALDTIYEQLAVDTDIAKAAALNEFMAWSLTNQHLINLNKTIKVRNPLAILTGKAIRLMRKILGSNKTDIYNNVLFNTEVLLSTKRNLTDYTSPNIILNQIESAGNDSRIEALSKAFDAKINSWIKDSDILTIDDVEISSYNNIDYTKAHQDATQTVNLFTSNGFPMTMQKATLFKQIQASLATQMEIDNLTLIRAQKLYKDTLEELSVEDFLDDPQTTDPYLRQLAQDRFKAITGGFEFKTDKQGNTNLLSSFIALSQVDDKFRQILQSKEIKKSKEITAKSFDDLLTSTANSLLNALAVSITREGANNVNTRQALDKLAISLTVIERDSATFIEKALNGAIYKGNRQGSKLIGDLGRAAFKFSSGKQKETDNAVKKTVLSSIKLASGLLDEDIGKISASALTSYANSKEFSIPLRELLNEVVNRTDENAEIIDQINEVKYNVSALRQEYREVLPQIIADQFKKLPSKELKEKMLKLFGKTDASSLISTYSVDKVLSMISNDTELNNEITKIEETLNNSDYNRKALQLSNFMNTGIAGNNLLTNAYAISKLLNEDKEITDATEETIKNIDNLISLYAIRDIDPAIKRTINAFDESNGYKFVLNYLNHLRQDENSKATDEVSKLNGYKGYIPTESQDGVRMVIADNSNHAQMILDGYTKVGDYESSKGLELGKRSYYYSNVNGNSTYSQGAMQTVQIAVNGVNPRTGKTLTGKVAGNIYGAEARRINKRIKGEPNTHTLALIKEFKDAGKELPDSLKNIKANINPEEGFIPRFNAEGKLSSLERSMAPDKLNRLNFNNDIGEMIGAWKGRQAEEQLAQKYNEILVENLYDKFVKDSHEGRSDEYIDISTETNDKVIQDIWSVVPKEMKDHIKNTFGKNGFKVRRDLINPALGYRNASVNDLFTDKNRLFDSFNKTARELFFMITPNARKYLSIGEKGLQTTVSGAKQIIVTKSVIVPYGNMLANTVQLSVRGVSPRFTLNKGRQKLVEIDTHLKNIKRKIEINAELIGLDNNTNQARKLQTELKSIDDAEARMSIAPLIKAGEFSTISEGLTDLDEALTNGRWIDVLEGGINKLPPGIRTVGKNALLTKDTALFKGLSRAVQYGDFLGKAIYFEHLTKNVGMSESDAMAKVTVEFVNYNLPEGRSRSYLESIGLTWFMNFKLRIIRIAVDMMQQNPFTALLSSVGIPLVSDVDIGSPIGDNFVTAGLEGRLPYSIGHDMLFESPQLNPWVNMIN